MVEPRVIVDNCYLSEALEVNKLEEEEDDFRSCCEDEDELKEIEEEYIKAVDSDENPDEHAVVKMYFKGVSFEGPSDSPGSRISGVGVVIEKSGDDCPLRVQKRLDFYVDECVADYLALLDGLSVAIQNDARRIYAFTDSEALHNQIIDDEVIIERPLLLALRERIKEQSTNIETFVLKLVPSVDLQKALHLAQVAVGIVISSPPPNGDSSTETCSICCEEKLSSLMLTIKCSHRFCSHCMKTYVECKVRSNQVPVKCPQLNCKYRILASECILFLPVTSYETFETAEDVYGANNRFICPYPGCSVLLDANEECSSECVECHGCGGLVCVACEVPWHALMTCDEYWDLESEEREDVSPLTMGRSKKWRRCQECRRMNELTHGRYHMSCLCGHEFCYSCGAGYRNGQQTCGCVFWDEDYPEELVPTYPSQHMSEEWSWDPFEIVDQERSRLALIQRFLTGSFGLMDDDDDNNNNNNNNQQQQPYHQSPPRCTDLYADAMKDLRQLPWLERFIHVISDEYYEDFIV